MRRLDPASASSLYLIGNNGLRGRTTPRPTARGSGFPLALSPLRTRDLVVAGGVAADSRNRLGRSRRVGALPFSRPRWRRSGGGSRGLGRHLAGAPARRVSGSEPGAHRRRRRFDARSGGASDPAAAQRATAAPPRRPEPRPDSAVPAAAPLQTEEPVELASALAAASPPGDRPPAASGARASQPFGGARSGTRGPPGGQLARARLGPGGGDEVGRLDRLARPAAPIRPHYPARARQRGDEADVGVDVWVGAGGEVDRVAISRSAGAEFDAAAIAAVHRARFHPALRDGEQVPSRVALRLHFRLDR